MGIRLIPALQPQPPAEVPVVAAATAGVGQLPGDDPLHRRVLFTLRIDCFQGKQLLRIRF